MHDVAAYRSCSVETRTLMCALCVDSLLDLQVHYMYPKEYIMRLPLLEHV
jgi:hypothetical protein